MVMSGTGTLVASMVSKIISSAAMVKAGGAVSGTILAGSQGECPTQPVSPGCLGHWSVYTWVCIGSPEVGIVLSGFPASALAVSPIGVKAAASVLVGAMTVAAVPPVLSAVGFTATGISASSLAAKMMSWSAIANGGGVPASGLVAILQSAGAAGLSTPATVLVGSAGSAIVASVMGICESIYPFVMATEVADIVTEVADVSTEVGDMGTEVADMVTEVADMATDKADIGTEVADMATDMEDIGTEVADIGTEVTDMVTEMADMATDMADIGTEVGDMGTEVADMGTEVADMATNETPPNFSNTEKD
ncbi:ISG12a protein [Apodemus speciosus]|uniref:ISG12a protein n=1 Tax=Apodemus speciosus TaxID=105296 RepID=A0ABQ0FEQ1_APOSI